MPSPHCWHGAAAYGGGSERPRRALAADVFMHYSVFVAPKGSTAALGLLFMPLWNLLLIGPAGALLCWLAYRVAGRWRGAAG